nr:hypothetical protein [Burkholderia sp. AU19243]
MYKRQAQPAARRAASAPHAAAPASGNDAKRTAEPAARAQKEAPAAGGYGPRLAKASAAPAGKPTEKPALVRPALNGEKPAVAAAGGSDDDWETF